MPTLRTYIYVDGFNLYHRALKGAPYKWLDLKELFVHLLGSQNDIQAIKYFTALVSGKIDPRQPIRQRTYIRGLEKHIPELTVHYGHFLSHEIDAPISGTDPAQFARIIKTEEKGSYVNSLSTFSMTRGWMHTIARLSCPTTGTWQNP